MRSVLGVLIAFAATAPSCVCTSSVDLDPQLMEGDAAPDACPSDWDECSAECVDTDSHHDNCGGCGNRCPPESICVTGECERECGALTLCAPDRCVDLTRDKDNCGECGLRCERGGCENSRCDHD